MASAAVPKLFEPIKLRSLEVKNRIWVSPMCQYSSVDGLPNTWHLVHLGARAIGQAGLIMAEASGVSPEGRITPEDAGIWNDAQAEAWAPIAAFIKEQGAVAAIQLAHAGRKASNSSPWNGDKPIPLDQGGWVTVGPSPVPFAPDWPAPRELSREEIKKVVQDFEDAAKRALAAGFQVVEIHGAHGYLLHTFASALSNKRTDEYGGSLDNRLRLPLEVAAAVRKVWPEDLPVFYRLSATDWSDDPSAPSWDIEQSVELSKRLKDIGIDLIDVSTGGQLPMSSSLRSAIKPGFQVPFAQAIRREAGIATGAVGLITKARQAEEILAEGQADAVFLAREFLRDPNFPLRAAAELGYKDVQYPNQYDRAKFRL